MRYAWARLAWCDKIGLVLSLLLFLLLLAVWQGNYFFWDAEPHAVQWGGTWIWDRGPPLWDGWWEFGRVTVLPIWVVLRAIDLLGGGPWRRRGAIWVRRAG